MRFRNLLPLSALVLASGAAGAALDAVFEREEPPEAGPQHRVLQQMVGDWDVDIHMGGDAKATATVRALPGGLFVLADMEGAFDGTPFHGRGMWGYNLERKKYEGVWADNFDSALQLTEGSYDESTKTLTMQQETQGFDGKPAVFRHVTRFVDADHYEFELSATSKETGQSTPMGVAHYTRRK